MPGIGVINNPRSKLNKKHPERISKMGYMLGSGGESRETWSFEDLDQVMNEFKREDIDILAINGGDGSIHITLSSLINTYGDKPLPKVTFLRGGTLNTICSSIGIVGNSHWLLYNLSEKYANGEPFLTTTRRPMCIDGDKYGFIFGNGIVANFMETYYEGEPSPTQGIKVLARGIASAITGGKLAKQWTRKLHASITIDGETLQEEEWTSILSGSVHHIGVGFAPWHRCTDEATGFHILAFDCSAVAIAKNVPFFYFSRPIPPEIGHEYVAHSVTIDSDTQWAYTVDGDMYKTEDGKMTLSDGPELEIILR